ncbi:class I SAM-dependent methyltransferase [bacterium]|nr:class I SAM-dependent methyltransferase [bacterium]
MKPDARAALRRFYQENAAYCEDLLAHDAAYHRGFLAFVARWLDARRFPRLLDLGCGTAASTACLSELGFRVVGSDLSPLFLSEGRRRCGAESLVCGDAFALPFGDGAFDAVVSYEFIEHVPDVPRVLAEMARLTRPGGRILISSPNLCSPFFALADVVNLLCGRGGRPVFAPTLPRALAWMLHNTRLCLSKLFSPEPTFLYREPDLSGKVVGGDADSAYLAHPYDLARELSRLGCRVLSRASGARLHTRAVAALLPAFAPFIGIVAEKKRTDDCPRNQAVSSSCSARKR